MVEKQSSEYGIVRRAAKLFNDPEFATPTDVKRMASRLLNDEKNAPNAEKSRSKPTKPRKKRRLLAKKQPAARRSMRSCT